MGIRVAISIVLLATLAVFRNGIPHKESKNGPTTSPTTQPRPKQVDATDGLVPPIAWNGPAQNASGDLPSHAHDSAAHFHAHGEQVCASGCAASRHPTEMLTRSRFRELLEAMAQHEPDADNVAYETLLYFGPQTSRMLKRFGSHPLDAKATELLQTELERTHVSIEIRVVDEYGKVRSWLPTTTVPLDRRHVFDMKTDGLPDLVTSGTAKRVGLHHIWVRL